MFRVSALIVRIVEALGTFARGAQALPTSALATRLRASVTWAFASRGGRHECCVRRTVLCLLRRRLVQRHEVFASSSSRWLLPGVGRRRLRSSACAEGVSRSEGVTMSFFHGHASYAYRGGSYWSVVWRVAVDIRPVNGPEFKARALSLRLARRVR